MAAKPSRKKGTKTNVRGWQGLAEVAFKSEDTRKVGGDIMGDTSLKSGGWG